MHQIQRSSLHSAAFARRNGPAFAALAVAIALGLGANAHAATFTVLNTDDVGAGSLRAAIESANLAPGADNIEFDDAVTGQIALASHITINDHVHITGPGLAELALDGGENNRIFVIAPPGLPGTPTTLAVTIEALTLQNGHSGSNGGCIDADFTALEVIDSLITGCNAGEGSGGGISVGGYNVNNARSPSRDLRDGKGVLPPEPGQASLVLRNTRVEGNTALSSGGGISILVTSGADAPDGFKLLEGSSVTGNQTRFGGPGGGVEVYGVAPFDIEMRESTISGNTAESSLGGGLVVYQANNAGSSVVIADSTISSNRLNLSYSGPFLRGGGGIALLTGATVLISGSTLADNSVGEVSKTASAKGGPDPVGGAILLQPSDSQPSFSLSDSQVTGNTAPQGGGVGLVAGIIYGGPPGKSHRVGYWRAQARASTGDREPSHKGEPQIAQLRIQDTVFQSNTAGVGAAILAGIGPTDMPAQGKGLLAPAQAVFERITLHDNAATGALIVGDEGGALLTTSVGLPVLLIDSTVSGNSGGGVIAFRYGTTAVEALLIDNSTIVGNQGSGVINLAPMIGQPPAFWKSLFGSARATPDDKAYPAQDSAIAIRNSIVHGNVGADDAVADISGNPADVHLLHSLIGMPEADLAGYDDGGGNLFDVDPLLGPLADNGGPTPTHLPLPGSPAIDAGDPAFAGPPAIDQRGLPRIGGAAVDMGAVETEVAPGTLQFDPASVTVNEPDGTVSLTVTRTDGADGDVGVSFASSDGSATAGLDFAAVGDTLTWADGDSAAKTITVPILDDAEVETDETFDLTLSAPTGNATVGSADTATVTIVSDDLPPEPLPGTLQFDPASATVDETAGTVTLSVTRTGGDDGEVGVSFATANGTASAGADFTAGAGTLTWGDGDVAAKTITVPILDDSEVEPDETFAVDLSAPTGGATLGSAGAATVTIVSDDQVLQPGVLGFDPAGYVVDEGAGTATLTVTRTGGSDGVVGVDFSSSDASATAGSDYTAVGGTLAWGDGDTLPKTISVAIIDDSEDEEDEDFGVTLSNPSGDATLGSDGASVTIADNDEAPPPGIVQFDGADDDGVLRLRINEDGSSAGPAKGLLTLRVVRMAGSEGPASVAYATVNGSATAPSDFVAAGGELTWADGEDGDKTIVLDIVEDDDAPEPDETFSVLLSDAQGAGLGGSLTAQIVIVANGTVAPPPAVLPAVIPANDWLGRIALFGGLLVAAWVALRRRF